MEPITLTSAFDRECLEPLFDLATELGITISNFSFDKYSDLTFTFTFPADLSVDHWRGRIRYYHLDELVDFLPDNDDD
jgi:hypothetical protein